MEWALPSRGKTGLPGFIEEVILQLMHMSELIHPAFTTGRREHGTADIFNMGNKVWLGILMGGYLNPKSGQEGKILRGNVWGVYQGKEVFNLFSWKPVHVLKELGCMKTLRKKIQGECVRVCVCVHPDVCEMRMCAQPVGPVH